MKYLFLLVFLAQACSGNDPVIVTKYKDVHGIYEVVDGYLKMGEVGQSPTTESEVHSGILSIVQHNDIVYIDNSQCIGILDRYGMADIQDTVSTGYVMGTKIEYVCTGYINFEKGHLYFYLDTRYNRGYSFHGYNEWEIWFLPYNK